MTGAARTMMAEGVEPEGEAALLREVRCDELQDDLFGKPMTAEAFLLWADTRELAAG